MPWKEVSTMSLRREFAELALQEGRNMARLCERFGISRKTGYKWLARHAANGVAALADMSRRPHESPGRTIEPVEQAIVALRRQHPAWGARKLRARLAALGHEDLPAASTTHAVLVRHGLISDEESAKHRAFTRFEHPEPNDLWQMDFKGHFPLTSGVRCHPLTVLDDHSRYSLLLSACGDELIETVRTRLTGAFRRYGLPRRMLMDNASVWRGGGDEPFSQFAIWLLRLGVRISHGRPLHPQTQGKEERFHRTLKAEVLQQPFDSFKACQRRFDDWREVYNLERPHESLGMAVPKSRYRESPRSYPERLPAIEYLAGDQVRKVSTEGLMNFRGHSIGVGKGFRGLAVALRATSADGVWDVYFSHCQLGQLHMAGPLVGPHGVPSFVRCAHSRRHAVTP
jgi:transposase InsO family protein